MRFSLASMLTALAILAAPAVSTRAQSPGPKSSAKARDSRAGTSAKVATPKVAAKPTTAEAEPMPSQADVSKKVIAGRKANDARKKAAAKAKLRMQMVATMRQSEIELERARLQAAQMEGAQRREAEASMVQLQTALSYARAMEFQQNLEYSFYQDNPAQYQRMVQAQIDAYNAQQRAIRDFTQRVTETLRERQGRSTTPLVGTSGSVPSSRGFTPGQSSTPSNPGGSVTRAQPSPQPVQRLEFQDRDEMAKMRARNKF